MPFESGSVSLALTATLDPLLSQLRAAKQQAQQTGDQIEQAFAKSAKGERLTAQIHQQEQALSLLKRQLGLLQGALDTTSQKYGENSTQAQKQQLAVDRLKASIANAEHDLATYNAALTAGAKASAAAAQQTENFGKHMGAIKDGLSATSDTLAKIALPMTAAGVAAGKLATDFDSNMRYINTIAKLPEDQLGKLGQQFITLSEDGSKTLEGANALSKGFYQIESSGFAGADAMKVLETSTKAASAGMTETSISGKAITSVLNAYHESADDAAHVSDVLFQTVNLGVVEFPELASSIGKVLPVAASAGVSFDQIAAGIATMTKSGISGSESVTDLTSLLNGIIKPSQSAADAASDLGIDLSLSGLKAKGFVGFLQDIRDKTGGNVEAMSQLIGTQEGLNAILSLTSNNLQDYKSDLDGIANSTGATDDAFAEMSKSTSAQLQHLKADFEALAITVGSRLLPALDNGVKRVSDLVTAFTQLPKDQQDYWVGIAEKVGIATVGMYGASTALEGVVSVGENAVKAYKGIAAAAALLGGSAVLVPVAALAAGTLAVAEAAKETEHHYSVMADRIGDSDPVIVAAREALYGKESGGGGQSWIIDATSDAEKLKQETDELRAHLSDLLTTQNAQEARVLALANAGQQYTGQQHAAAEALAQTKHEIEAVTSRLNDYDKAQQHVADMVEHEKDQATAIANTGSAYQTAAQGAHAYGRALSDVVGQVTKLDPKTLDKIAKEADAAVKGAITAYGSIAGTEVKFFSDRETAQQQHEDKIAGIIEKAGGPRKAARDKAAQKELEAENKAYADQERAQNLAFAQEEANNRKHLGQMLLDWISAQAQLHPDDKALQERAGRAADVVRQQYGIVRTEAEKATSAATAAATRFLTDSTESAGEFADTLQGINSTTIETQKTLDSIRGVYEADIRTHQEGRTPEQIADDLSNLDKRVELTIEANPELVGQTFSTLDELDKAVAKARILRVHTEADPAQLDDLITKADQIDSRAPAEARVDTNAPAATDAINTTSSAQDALAAKPTTNVGITTNAPEITGQISDTSSVYDGLAAKPEINHTITTNAASVSDQLRDVGTNWDAVQARAAQALDIHISTNAADVAGELAAVTADMDNMPRYKQIQIAAAMDPELRHKSPSLLELEMREIEAFASHPHVFRFGADGVDHLGRVADTVHSINANPLFSGSFEYPVVNDLLHGSFGGSHGTVYHDIRSLFPHGFADDAQRLIGMPIGVSIVEGMKDSALKEIPALWDALKKAALTNGDYNEIVGFAEDDPGATLNAYGAKIVNDLLKQLAFNARIAGKELHNIRDYIKGSFLPTGREFVDVTKLFPHGFAAASDAIDDLQPKIPSLTHSTHMLTHEFTDWHNLVAGKLPGALDDLGPRIPPIADGMERMAAATEHLSHYAGVWHDIADLMHGHFSMDVPDAPRGTGGLFGRGVDDLGRVADPSPSPAAPGDATAPDPAKDTGDSSGSAGHDAGAAYGAAWAQAVMDSHDEMAKTLQSVLQDLTDHTYRTWLTGQKVVFDVGGRSMATSLASGFSGAAGGAIGDASQLGADMRAAIEKAWGPPSLAKPTIGGSPNPAAPPVDDTTPVKWFASGVHDFDGGWAWTGEKGPELAYWPPHTSIIDSHTSAMLAAVSGINASITIPRMPDPVQSMMSNISQATQVSSQPDSNEIHLHMGPIDLRGSTLTEQQVQNAIDRSIKKFDQEGGGTAVIRRLRSRGIRGF